MDTISKSDLEQKTATIRQEVHPAPDAGCPGGLPDGALALGGKPDAAVDAIARPGFPRRARATKSLIRELVADVTSSGALMRQTGVTRQRVDQILWELMRDGTVKRMREPGTRRQFLWFRSDVDPFPTLFNRQRPLMRNAVMVLNCLSADASHSMLQIARHLGMPYYLVASQIVQLTRMDLVSACTAGRPKLVSITPLGLAHPDRDVAASTAPTSDASFRLRDRKSEFIQTLAVLEEARTIDMTAALRTKGREAHPLSSGPMMRLLVLAGIAERADGGSGKRPSYRLTDAGKRMAGLIGRRRPPPAREYLEANITAYRARMRASRENGPKQRPASAQVQGDMREVGFSADADV
jgi:DNA-binding MarR family transcriptional regulator